MSVFSNLSEFQVITVCVIGTTLVLFSIAAITAGVLGVLHRKA
jgi:hypothetical protein